MKSLKKKKLILKRKVELEDEVGGMERFSFYILMYYKIFYKNMFCVSFN